MRRVIKFRAWDEVDGMLYPEFDFVGFNSFGSHIVSGTMSVMFVQESTDGNGKYHEDPNPRWETLKWMQFTGLTDKNGKEIYEGDIVNINNPANTGEIYGEHTIIFHEGCFMIDRRYSYAHVPLMTYALISEVIGNIYQNGDLLNG